VNHTIMLSLHTGFYVSKGLVPVRVMLSAIGFTYSLIFATQGLLQTWTDARSCSAALSRVQRTLSELTVDESMSDALPPGAWWDKANKIQGTCPAFEEEDGEPDGEPEEISKRTEGRVQGTAVSALAAARSGDLVMSNVDFSYPVRPDYPVLKNLSLTLPRGKVTAIVGRSGAGKSTVASLIERLYPLDRGSIKLNGVDIARFTRQEWVNAVTAVSQEPVLFSGTIFENIAYGRPHASVAEVEKAALAANAHDFILSLPEAYESVVGDRGVLLSGGQRQRVALARALLQDAPILILDEATSALDGESERLVQQAIENLVANRTVLIIAHRLSTVQAADQILVMDDGRIVEQGTHVELLRLEGMYKKLVSSQALTLSASVGSLP
jgi:ATP-binding cassette subfamily B (MDR/TAP) protein 10